MSTDKVGLKALVEYVMDQLSDLENVRYIPMMGGYLFYINDRVFGGIYDRGSVMVKITPASRKWLSDVEPEPPYESAKDMLTATNLDDREAFSRMVAEMADELPPPKPKKPRKKQGT